MSWFGKMLGAGIGFLIGGPLGAVLGAVFGHSFDIREEERGKNSAAYEYRRMIFRNKRENIFFIAAFSMMAKLSKVDGRVSEAEINAIEEIMKNDLKLNAESRSFAIQIFRSALLSPENFESFAEQFARTFYGQEQLLRLMVDILYKLAASDGHVSSNEERLIKSAIYIFGLSSNSYDHFFSSSSHTQSKKSPNAGPYKVLDLPPSASDEEVKKQYRKLVREYHPDTIASLGLPEDFTAFAKEKFIDVQKAYEDIKKQRGIK